MTPTSYGCLTDISLNRDIGEGAIMSAYCRRSDQPGSELEPPVPRLVDSAEAALEVVLAATHTPPRAEVIALLLDEDLRGRSVVVVDGTLSPDAVVEVMEMLGEAVADADRDQAIVLTSVRTECGPLPGDVDRWLELNEIADTYGCELMEWFVVTDGVAWCPRDFLAEPPRWPAA